MKKDDAVVVNPSTSKPFFAYFDLPETYEIDLGALEQAYIQKQRLYHPDKQIGLSACQKLPLIQQSILCNEAYAVLKDPIKRAAYLLDCLDKEDTIRDPVLLSEIFELQEQASELLPDQRQAFSQKIQKQIGASLQELRLAFQHKDDNLGKKIYFKLRYLSALV